MNKKLSKKVAIGMTTATISTLLLNAGIAIANAESISQAPKAVEVNKDTEIPSKYSFVGKFNQNTAITTFGADGRWVEKTDYDSTKPDDKSQKAWTLFTPTDQDKGNIGVVYHNVGKYNGQNVNLKITLLDWKTASKYDGNKAGQRRVSFSESQINHQQTGFDSVKQRWEYIDDNGNPIDMKGSFLTFYDLDYAQSIKFDSETSKNIENILYEKGCDIQYFDENGDIKLSAKDGQVTDDNNKKTMFTALFNSGSITFDWMKDYSLPQPAGIDGMEFGGNERIGFLGKKLAKTETIAPVKKVSDSDEQMVDKNKLTDQGEHYTYTIDQAVPDEFEEFYYSDFALEDKLIPELELSGDAKIVNENGDDVTNWFENKSEGNKLRFEAKGDVLKNKDFYYHTYTIQVPVKVKDGADLSPYKQDDGTFVLPNTAKSIINKTDKNSNEVETVIDNPEPSLEPKIQKEIIDNGKKVETDEITDSDPTVTYEVDNTIPNDKDVSDLMLEDDLHDALDLANGKASVKVIATDADSNEKAKSTDKKAKAKAKEAEEGKSDKEVSADSSKEKESKSSDKDVETESSKENTSGSTDKEPSTDSSKESEPLPEGDDVTSQGNLEIVDGNHVKWTANNPNDFKGKKLMLVIEAKAKDNVDTSSLEDGKIPNTARMTLNGQGHDSNTVLVTLEPKTPEPEKPTPTVDNEIEKEIIDEGKEVDTDTFTADDQIVTYAVENIISDKQDISSLLLEDDLEDVLELADGKDSVKVIMSDPSSESKSDKAESKSDKAEPKSEPRKATPRAETKQSEAETKQSEAESDKVDTAKTSEGAVAKSSAKGSSEGTKVDEGMPKGEDVTDQGKLEITDGNHIKWTPNDPSKFKGKKLTLVIDTKLKAGADLSKYKDGKIPNTAKLTVNGEELTSNTVYVDTEKVPEVPVKPSSETPKSAKSTVAPKVTKTTEPTSATPEQGTPKQAKTLPQTGIAGIGAGLASLATGATGLGALLFKRRKK